MKKRYWAALGFVIIVLIGGVCWYWYLHKAGEAPSNSPQTLAFVPEAAGQNLSGSATSTDGYIAYTNQQYHFSLLYPPNLQLSQYGGGGGALTVVFQDPSTHEGFQVFVVPYDQPQITLARFKMDEPSGVLENPTDVVIDGVRATMFYSSNTTMGDTREVWFINGGLLYEVTTYEELDSWLGQIMQTWQFTP